MSGKTLLYKAGVTSYPQKDDCFSPSIPYPEYPFKGAISSTKNKVYDAIRNALYAMGYDSDHFGTTEWNPLGKFIKHGDIVLLKPNLVRHFNPIRENGIDCLITHPSIIRAVADYALIALAGTGKLTIGDAPIQSCEFDVLCRKSGLDLLLPFWRTNGITTELVLEDFRNCKTIKKCRVLVKVANDTNENKGLTVDLGNESSFAGLPQERLERFRVQDYAHSIMQQHHIQGKHEYIVAKRMLEADVIINLPKPKTHRFAGVTIALKNYVGINANKELLPHHSIGSVSEQGDEYHEKNGIKRLHAKLVDVKNIKLFKHQYVSAFLLQCVIKGISITLLHGEKMYGTGPQNDTIWRTIHDLNKIVYFADVSGKLRDTPQRKILIIGDMIISGEKEGPMEPAPKETGVIVIGENPVCFDETVCAFMGFDYRKIPTISQARHVTTKYDFSFGEDALIISNDNNYNGKHPGEVSREMSAQFVPRSEWAQYLLNAQ
jgi:uncharacterized protein (DUF362 family)